MDAAVRDLAHEARADGGELVDAARAVHDERAVRSELQQRFRDRPHERRRVNADDLRAGTGGVRQRAEHVEHGTRSELPSDRGGVLHRRVVGLREHEAEAELVDRAGDALRLELEVEAERLEHVGRACLRRRGAVAVLCHTGARGRSDERGGGRDVERALAVAAGARGVDEVGARRLHGEHVVAHRLRAARDLVGGLALRAQRDEEACDLCLRRLAAHDLVHRLERLRAREVVAVEHPGDRRLDHSLPSRKLRASAGPSGVSTDSGWNWTPTIGSSRWRTAITSPSSAYAVGTSSSGSFVAASEW